MLQAVNKAGDLSIAFNANEHVPNVPQRVSRPLDGMICR